jgi:hypothetical protein
MIRIGFLALSQAHQIFHWLPAALRLAREPGVEVTVLCPSRAGIDFIRSYDPQASLKLEWLAMPRRRSGLFNYPRRARVLALWGWYLRRFPTLVTTESTSIRLRRPGLDRPRMIRIRHGAGDGTRVFDRRITRFDLTLVAGEKDRQRLIDVGHVTDENCLATGYAKFELVRPPEPLFGNTRPVALYNPHFRPDWSSWHSLGADLMRSMAEISDWNFIVAPHVKTRGGPTGLFSAPNVIIDGGSRRSIDMTYTQAASVYIGDVSSQVYEFLRRPRPCIFINAHGVEGWRDDDAYANWKLGQVISRPEELAPALARAHELQARFEPLQRQATERSLGEDAEPASERQARAILDFIRRTGG